MGIVNIVWKTGSSRFSAFCLRKIRFYLEPGPKQLSRLLSVGVLLKSRFSLARESRFLGPLTGQVHVCPDHRPFGKLFLTCSLPRLPQFEACQSRRDLIPRRYFLLGNSPAISLTKSIAGESKIERERVASCRIRVGPL